jgi:hypothetical protein
MDSIVSVSNRLDVKAQAWRISFSETPPEDETVFATITEPQRLVVTARSIEVVRRDRALLPQPRRPR